MSGVSQLVLGWQLLSQAPSPSCSAGSACGFILRFTRQLSYLQASRLYSEQEGAGREVRRKGKPSESLAL